ncbi:MAG: radical SAM protein [Candidatus Eisenbacteria bacterium]|nr:radical SAM protein [Candidatus Eisenbacteria bacterium]
MSKEHFRYLYGPVPSRRLGRSLGVDLVPLKTCTYDCIYCQLGRTTDKTCKRKEYVAVDEVVAELERKLATLDTPDYISLSGSGEPTLNSGIGDLIRRIKGISKVPVAVLTNGSLLWRAEVQDALMAADLVIPSLDAGDERLFHYVNRPHTSISFERVVDGIAAFTARFPGKVWLEVFLLAGVTDMPSEVKKTAALAKRIAPARVQLNTVARPAAEGFALPVPHDKMLSIKSLFAGGADIIAEAPPEIARAAGTFEAGDEEMLSLLSRRPCTAADVAKGLKLNVTEALKQLELLRAAGKVTVISSGGRTFYTVGGPVEASRK